MTYTYEGSEPADILSFNLADNSLIQLTDNQWNPGVFSWLPDSQSLTYPQLNNLYLISLDNPLHPENLFTFDGYINYHAWSPDGHYLAILHAPSTQPHYGDVFDLLNTETNSFSTISEGSATPDRFLWSPNSQWISFSQYINRGLQLFNISTDEVKELAPFDNQIYSEWSPNEAWLAYTNDSKLFLWDANTETDKQLIDINVFGKPSWSPDGTQIAVSYTNNEQPGIMIVDVANGSHQKLDIGIRASQIIWSPDEEWLLFFSEVDNRAGLYMVHKDDDTPILILRDNRQNAPI
ncbi:MAG: DPP IV N-terminal domain-containing protein [Chloroflexi bacterium]|nr:DPP IV N-terminal domain-containing protein [Chloroflexota bacterium]